MKGIVTGLYLSSGEKGQVLGFHNSSLTHCYVPPHLQKPDRNSGPLFPALRPQASIATCPRSQASPQTSIHPQDLNLGLLDSLKDSVPNVRGL